MDQEPPTNATESTDGPAPGGVSADHIRQLRDRAQEVFSKHQEDARKLEAELAQQLEVATAALAAELSETQQLETEATSQALAAEREAIEQERAEWEKLREQIEADLEQRQAALASQQAAVEQASASESSQVAALQAELKTKDEQHAATVDKLQIELNKLRADLSAAIAGAEAAENRGPDPEREAAWQSRVDALEAERETLAGALSEAGGNAAQAQAANQELQKQAAENADLNNKFELALADIQQQRTRIAELEQELATRPAPDAAESAELAQLRDQCDSLKQVIAELEARPEPVAADSEEVSDLRRRFELAVEDVRQLKTEKAALEEQLASAPSAAVDIDSMDWEAQKQRMLASLEGEGDPGTFTPERQQERAKIEATVRITDDVVAEKDRQLAELRSELEQASTLSAAAQAAPTDAPPMDDDARFEAERERLGALEKQWEEKLRAAELELSVGRAKIAREKAELAELQADLDSQKRSIGNGRLRPPREATVEEPQRRNWLNKLGLGGEEG